MPPTQETEWSPPGLKVLPNPWLEVHATLGPIAVCVVDLAGREDAPIRYVGARHRVLVVEKREPMKIGKSETADPRGHRTFARFEFPSLSADMLSGEPIEVAETSYYREKLVNGELIPGDAATARRVKCRFADLKEAKAHGVAKLESEIPGRWAELAKHYRLDASAKPAAAAPEEKTRPENKPAEGSKS